jgi:hypothetical protein
VKWPLRRRRTDEHRAPDTGRLAGRRLGALLALVVAIGVVIAIVLAGESSPSSGSPSNANASSGATAVETRNLTETDTESGTLSYANTYTVYDRLSGTITWLPAVGQVIKPGQALYDVGGEPVLLMGGTTPAYRDLDSSDSDGSDILELNRNLVKLGFDAGGIVTDDEWQAATTEGVDLLQESLGETQTGDLTLGQVVFLPGDQLVSNVETTLGSDGSGGGSQAAYDPPAEGSSPEFVSLTTSSGPGTSGSGTVSPGAGTTPSSNTPSKSCKPSKKSKSKSKSKSGKDPCNSTANTVAALTQLLKAATAELNATTAELNSDHGNGGSPSKSGSPSSSGKTGNTGNTGSSGNSGDTGDSGDTGNSGDNGGGTATAIMQTSSTQLVATVDLDATKQSEAKVGEQVQVELPNGTYVNGKITAVSPVAQSSSGDDNGNGNGGGGGNNNNNSSGAVIPVTIALSGHQTGAGLDQAAVSVNFSEVEDKNVLSVPVTALLATSGGNYEVQEATPPHKLIPVTTGLFAAGYVAITGSGIYPGLEVTDSQG